MIQASTLFSALSFSAVTRRRFLAVGCVARAAGAARMPRLFGNRTDHVKASLTGRLSLSK